MTQAERIKKAVGEFGREAKAKLAGGGQPEDQLRNPLEQLFKAMEPECGLPTASLVLTGELSLAELRTRPDFAVEVQNALIGFIEVKAPGKGADPRKWKAGHDKEQWDKLKALPNLLYTDGNAFSLWRDGELVDKIVHLEGDIVSSGNKLDAPDSFHRVINDFLTGWTPIAPKGPNELAKVAARLCRFLRDEVIEQLAIKNAKLTELKEDWKALLFPDADDAKFADGYAQAVTFGLLMAKSKGLSLADGLDDVAKELGKANTLIGTALRLLTEQDLNLGPALATLTRVLDVVSWDKISKGDPEAWLYFYENFLAVYDNKLRKQTGSYYTPPQVVQAMVRLCDEALKSGRFGIIDGLAGKDVHIIDPAAGSGTFLLGLLASIKATVEANHGGPGAVPEMMNEVAKRLVGFELQFGAFAVAQLRLLAEMIDIGADATPQMFVTDTLGDPFEAIERAPGLVGEISKSRIEASRIKREQPVTVVIGNPPYKNAAMGKGSWVENGSGNKAAPLNDWQPPVKWGVGADAKNLRNLYVYFWRWATWKVFEQGAGGRDKEPPLEEKLAGMICYITVAGFLNGPGFQKMRHDLRRDCDEIWVIDCSPEGHQPKVATRVFQGVQQPICIVLALRTNTNDPGKPARVRYRALATGKRNDKFTELEGLTLGGKRWLDGAKDWRAPFLPEFADVWGGFVPLEQILGDTGLGSMTGRTWVVSPDPASLKERWSRLVNESDREKRAQLFHPHLRKSKPGDKHIGKATIGLGIYHDSIQSVSATIDLGEGAKSLREQSEILKPFEPIRYGFRSFDRQWIIPDNRLINQPSPGLWTIYGPGQVYLTALSRSSPRSGPAVSLTGLIPDHDHYKGSASGRVFALWTDAAATEANISSAVLAELTKAFGSAPDPVDVFAYVAGLLAHPAYTARFAADLVRPGLRVPVTADAALFAEAAALGREVIWLHSFGERMGDGKPTGPPRVPTNGPNIPLAGKISGKPEDFPDSIDYDAAQKRLKIGTGFIDNVPPAVWSYEVSGKNVLRQWFSYRKKNRERPLIGDKRKPSPLCDIQPDHWLPEYTTELINVLNVLTLLVELEPRQADVLQRVCDGPLVAASKVAA